MTCKKCGHFKPEPNQVYGYSGPLCQCTDNEQTMVSEGWKRKFVVEVGEDLQVENNKLKERIAFLEGKIEGLETVFNRQNNKPDIQYPLVSSTFTGDYFPKTL